MDTTAQYTTKRAETRLALRNSQGYLVVADDGPVGQIEIALEAPDPGTDYVVVRARGRLLGRHPVVSSHLVCAVDRARHLVYVRGTRRQIRRLPESLPLAI